MFVITDSLVPFVRGLLGGMSQGPAQTPCNSARYLMPFSPFSALLTWLCCPGIRDEWQSSAELSTAWTCDEETSAEEFAGYCWWAKLMVQTLHILWADCFGGVAFSKGEVSWHLAKAKRAILFSSFWLDTSTRVYQSAGLFFCTEG